MPTMSNQMPQVLSWHHTEKVGGDLDPLSAVKEMVVTPLLTPMNANVPVIVKDDDGNTMDEDDIVGAIVATCGNAVDQDADEIVKSLLSQGLIYYNPNTNLLAQELFAVQSGISAKLPEPNAKTFYTAQYDIKPVCGEFISGACDYHKLFASFAFYARPNTLGFYFRDESVFDEFKAHFNAQAQAAVQSGNVDMATAQKLSQFQALTLDKLTESLILRSSDTDDNHEFSFSRQLTYALMTFSTVANTPEEKFGCFPFVLGEMLCPRTIVFVNIERHAKATPKAIEDEWNIIKTSLNMPVKMVSMNQLKHLTAMARAKVRIQAQSATAQQLSKTAQAMRSAAIVFPPNAPSRARTMRLLKKVLDRMKTVSRSENVFKMVKSSFARPNRRNPDDFNLKGKIVSTRYMPDIHLYVDTSGSITEDDYKGAIQTCIAMAKKLDVNLYFNSFSHIMSQTVLLKTRDQSTAETYRQFQKTPKVDGGTDYEQIWNFINASKKRKRELSIIITDFDYMVPNRPIEHPKNLYYVPCAMVNWDSIKRHARTFCKRMMHIDPAIRTKLLF